MSFFVFNLHLCHPSNLLCWCNGMCGLALFAFNWSAECSRNMSMPEGQQGYVIFLSCCRMWSNYFDFIILFFEYRISLALVATMLQSLGAALMICVHDFALIYISHFTVTTAKWESFVDAGEFDKLSITSIDSTWPPSEFSTLIATHKQTIQRIHDGNIRI